MRLYSMVEIYTHRKTHNFIASSILWMLFANWIGHICVNTSFFRESNIRIYYNVYHKKDSMFFLLTKLQLVNQRRRSNSSTDFDHTIDESAQVSQMSNPLDNLPNVSLNIDDYLKHKTYLNSQTIRHSINATTRLFQWSRRALPKDRPTWWTLPTRLVPQIKLILAEKYSKKLPCNSCRHKKVEMSRIVDRRVVFLISGTEGW